MIARYFAKLTAQPPAEPDEEPTVPAGGYVDEFGDVYCGCGVVDPDEIRAEEVPEVFGMKRIEHVAEVLRLHTLTEATGGTATGSRWHCGCGASGVTGATRDYAQALGRLHVAEEIVKRLRNVR